MTILLIVSFMGACVLSGVFTMVVRRLAGRFGLTDRPDSHRKLHDAPIPLGGGLVTLAATACILGVVLLVLNPRGPLSPENWSGVVTFAAAATLIVALGLLDDYVGLRGRYKLLGQLAVAGILIANGPMIERLGLFGMVIDLGPFGIPFTLFWLVGAINALNLLDGIDGLATTLGIIISLTIAAMAVLGGHPLVAFVAVVFAGSLLGFLRFNFPPASIYLGDSGSMLIGMMVGVMAIRGSLKSSGTILLAAPLAVLAIPILDSAMAILRRKLTGRSIYTTDRGHLHHQLFQRLGTNRKVLTWIAVLCLITSTTALASLFLKNDLVALVSCTGLLVVFIATGAFGRAEFLLVTNRVRRIGVSLMQPVRRGSSKIQQSKVRLQGSREWGLLWATLTESADKLGLQHITLDLNLPQIHEGFHATWEQALLGDRDRRWKMVLPLVANGQLLGHLTVCGERNGEPLCDDINLLLEICEPFETRLQTLTERHAVAPFDLIPVAVPGNDHPPVEEMKG